MIFGIDVSKYNSLDQISNLLNNGFAGFVICNIDDPGYGDKQHLVTTFGRPFGPYKWVYAGENMVNGAINACNRARAYGEPQMGMWWDYEDNGVTQNQLVDAFHGADSVGMKSGYYTNLWRVDHAALQAAVGDRPLWGAGYPGNNDGSFPGMGSIPSGWPLKLWQYSSTNGSLDVNVVVDETWFANWVGGTIDPAKPKGGSKVLIVHHEVGKSALTDGGVIIKEFGGAPGAFGIPQEALDFQTSTGSPALNLIGDAGSWQDFITRSTSSKLGNPTLVAVHKTATGVEAGLVIGDVLVKKFDGPAGAFGIPQTAIDYSRDNAAAVTKFADSEWNDLAARTATANGSPVVIPGPAPDLTEVKAAAKQLSDALAKF